MKLLWTGTDSLMLLDVSRQPLKKKIYWIIFRVLARIIDVFADEHYCDSENVADNVRKFGMKKKISVVPDKLNHTDKYPKIDHDGFNVIYYLPNCNKDKKFKEWLYGYDVFKKISSTMPYVNFVILDGTNNMEEIYPLTDFYLRPNRHDGASRMVQECKIQQIPYYHSVTDPNFEEAIKSINEAYRKQLG